MGSGRLTGGDLQAEPDGQADPSLLSGGEQNELNAASLFTTRLSLSYRHEGCGRSTVGGEKDEQDTWDYSTGPQPAAGQTQGS